MHTHFIGKEEVVSYSRDFLTRLQNDKSDFPYIWCPIGLSGKEFTKVILDNLDVVIRNKIKVVPLLFNRDTNEIKLLDNNDSKYFEENPSVLIVDSAVHSGTTMFKAVKLIEALKVITITSYSLVVKRGSLFIPNYFGLIIAEYDRALFLLDSIPNNRLTPNGIIRKLMKDDVYRDPDHLNTSTSMDECKWSDLWYDVQAKKSHIYVYEQNNKIHGFISFQIVDDSHWFIDGVAVDNTMQKRGIAGNLMRFVETLARSRCCENISLWAVTNKIEWYEGFDFKLTNDTILLDLVTEQFKQMSRKLLYNLDFPSATV